MKKTYNSENMPNVQKVPNNRANLKINKIISKKVSPNDLIFLQENNHNLKIYFEKN
jgi:hypothetical protein